MPTFNHDELAIIREAVQQYRDNLSDNAEDEGSAAAFPGADALLTKLNEAAERDPMDALELARQVVEEQTCQTWQQTMAVLKARAPSAAQYAEDSDDNMDGWEGHEEAFFMVLTDYAMWLNHQ